MNTQKRLTFFTNGEDTFLRDIVIELRDKFNIKFFQRGTPDEFYQLLHDTDVAWFEWCDQLAIEATNRPKMCKNIIRLHSYEAFTNMPANVKWENVDLVIFVNEVVADFCIQKFKIPIEKTVIIHNGINLDRFNIPTDKKFNKKIAYVGYLNYKKSPELLIPVFKAIYDYDKEYTFHIAGVFQDERLVLYFKHLLSFLPFKINIGGWVDDVNSYLADKDFVISSSLFESFQYSLAEGMACGCVPLVPNWMGSELFYPKENLWTFPEDCVKIIDEFSKFKNKKEAYNNLRKYISRFDYKNQIEEIYKVIDKI